MAWAIWLPCLWMAFCCVPVGYGMQLGEPVDDKVLDQLFEKMGQAYVNEFLIEEESLVFEVIAEDTIGESEFWVIDFQPYNEYLDAMPVDPDTGDILTSNTGECSNVMPMGTFSSNGAGYYFSDDGNFVTRNVSIVDAAEGNFKRLFSSYVRGSSYIDIDQYGQNVTKRDYLMKYTGNLGFFFNCTNSDGENIWIFQNTTDTIEYHTTMYVTNVRPIDPADGTKGVGFVSSSITLIYRLSRIAIANFVIASSPLIKPLIDFVIIRPYFDDAGDPVTTIARVEIQFKTYIPSSTTNGNVLYYLNGTETYDPENTDNSLATHLNFTLPNGLMPCEFLTDDQCTQTWNFELLLNVDDTVAEDDMPIDATGVFTFQYDEYECTDTTTDPPTGCVKTDTSPFVISMDITIQTVVIITDAEKDYPSLYLLSITGTNNNDLRGGIRAGTRGVNHLEPVNMKIQMLPEFLRDIFNMELTLFMVCKNDQTEQLGGCLDTALGNRYIAYQHDDFRFSAVDDSGTEQQYTTADLDSDNWSPDGDNKTQQFLEYHGYDESTAIYDIDFINSALSQERLEYTITTVFRLNEKTPGSLVPARRRRSVIEEAVQSGTGDRVIMVHSAVYTRSAPGGAVMLPEIESGHRQRRDAASRARDPTDHHVTFMYAGCPENSLYDQATLACICGIEEYYSEKSFECEKSSIFLEKPTITPSSADNPRPLYFLSICIIIVLVSAYL